MTEPINLMERYGKRYRIGFDPAYDPKGRPRDKLDPWYMELPGQRGTIYPHGGNDLAVMVDGHPIIAGQIGRIPGVEIIQDGDDEKTFRFPAELFQTIARIVRPYCRPQISDEERQRRAEQLRQNLRKTQSSEANAGV